MAIVFYIDVCTFKGAVVCWFVFSLVNKLLLSLYPL